MKIVAEMKTTSDSVSRVPEMRTDSVSRAPEMKTTSIHADSVSRAPEMRTTSIRTDSVSRAPEMRTTSIQQDQDSFLKIFRRTVALFSHPHDDSTLLARELHLPSILRFSTIRASRSRPRTLESKTATRIIAKIVFP